MKTGALSLDIIVVGAGLGGLATAIALIDKGHRVTVLEATPTLITVGAGIQIPPISSRVMRRWGLEKTFSSKITLTESYAFRNYATGNILGQVPINPFSQERYGCPWWTIHRADYQEILYNAALNKGAQVIFNSQVVSVDASATSITTEFKGTKVTRAADLIIGADGLRSRMRTAVLGDRDPSFNASTICAYRALVPLEAMLQQPLLEPLMDAHRPRANVWLGPSHFVLAYPIRQGSASLYSVVLVHPEHDSHTKHDLPPRFPRPAVLTEISEHYNNFSDQVQALVASLVPEESAVVATKDKSVKAEVSSSPKSHIMEWKLSDFRPLQTWRSDSNTILLIGDAAHAGHPYLAAGAAMAVEDAVALAECLDQTRLQSKKDLPKMLEAFERIRKPRTDRVQLASASDAPLWDLPDGRKQARRDALFENLASTDRSQCASAMRTLTQEGLGTFNFGDAAFMDWMWSYDVLTDTTRQLDDLKYRSAAQ